MMQANSGGSHLVTLSDDVREVFTFSWPNEYRCQGASSLRDSLLVAGSFEQ